MASPGCKAATLNICMKGNSLCAALAFGASAMPDSLKAFASFAKSYCPMIKGGEL